jgi:hypothetical protein
MTKYRMVVLKSGLLWQSYDIFATDDATAKDLAQQRFDELSRARVGGEAGHAEGPAGVVNGEAPGNTPLLTAAHRQALLQIVESGPIPAVHGVVRWRLIDLAQWVFEEFRISIRAVSVHEIARPPTCRFRFGGTGSVHGDFFPHNFR